MQLQTLSDTKYQLSGDSGTNITVEKPHQRSGWRIEIANGREIYLSRYFENSARFQPEQVAGRMQALSDAFAEEASVSIVDIQTILGMKLVKEEAFAYCRT